MHHNNNNKNYVICNLRAHFSLKQSHYNSRWIYSIWQTCMKIVFNTQINILLNCLFCVWRRLSSITVIIYKRKTSRSSLKWHFPRIAYNNKKKHQRKWKCLGQRSKDRWKSIELFSPYTLVLWLLLVQTTLHCLCEVEWPNCSITSDKVSCFCCCC